MRVIVVCWSFCIETMSRFSEHVIESIDEKVLMYCSVFASLEDFPNVLEILVPTRRANMKAGCNLVNGSLASAIDGKVVLGLYLEGSC